MNINDYIRDATSKIFDAKEKRKVEAELTDHILKHKEFNEEIGYDAEKAEEMAVEKMGEGTDIAELLGTLHNDFYTPVGDIICTVIWLLLLGGAYYLLKEFIFDDIAMVPLTIAGISIATALYFIMSFVMLKRNRLQATICNTVGATATSAFIFLCTRNFNRLVSGSFDKLKNLIFNHQICNANHEKSKVIIIITIVSFGALALFAILTSLSYYIKHSTNSNSLFDNHFKKFASGLTIVIALICVTISGLFVYNYFDTKNYLKDEYKKYYNQVIEMTVNYRTFDEIAEYVKTLDDEYRITSYKDDVTQKLTFVKNLVKIEIERKTTVMDDTVMTEYGLVTENSILDTSVYSDCTIYFNMNYSQYYDDYDHPVIKQILTKESELDEISKFDMEKHTEDEKLKFYPNYAPYSLVCRPSQDNKYYTRLEWTFLTGDVYKYQRHYSACIYSDEYLDIRNRQYEIADIIKANQNANFSKIAKLTNTELIPYPISYEDYKSTVNMLGSMFDAIKNISREEYNQLSQFKVSDDMYFVLGSTPYSYVSFSSETNLQYINIIEFDNGNFVAREFGDNELFKKMLSVGNGYYAKNGLLYNYDLLPYFEKNGTRYTLYTMNEDPGDKSGYIKHYYLINTKGEKYEHDMCYIDSEGYLYFDTGHTLKIQDDGLTYKDANGNKYTRAFETSWDKDGNIVEYKK